MKQIPIQISHQKPNVGVQVFWDNNPPSSAALVLVIHTLINNKTNNYEKYI